MGAVDGAFWARSNCRVGTAWRPPISDPMGLRRETYKPGLNDYDELVQKILSANADVVYVGGYAGEAGTIRRPLRELASSAIVVGGDALQLTNSGQLPVPRGKAAWQHSQVERVRSKAA